MTNTNEPNVQPQINKNDIGLFVADHVNAMLAYWDKDCVCRFANNAYKEWFGKGREELVDKVTIQELLGPVLYEKNRVYIEGVLKGIPQHFERQLQIPTGEIRQTTASYYPDITNGELRGFFVHVADITELKKAEEMMRTYSALEAKNKELEQFVYAASHDLQEPLNTIKGFTEQLQKQYHGKLDKDADTYLHYMSQSAKRLSDLIKGLLDYALIGQEPAMELVDCNEIVNIALNDLAAKIENAKAKIEVEKFPVITANRLYVKALFQNLISNAIKFRRKEVTPTIKISAERKDTRWVFKVKDNGIGIEEQYRKKIFIIFKRLHNRSEIAGNGIGLAHCKKIVEMHHGDIWVESVYGQGSTFYFTLNA